MCRSPQVLLIALLPLAGFSAERAYVIVGTGQTKCYDNRNEIAPPKPGQQFYGQDAQYQGSQPSYKDRRPSADLPAPSQ